MRTDEAILGKNWYLSIEMYLFQILLKNKDENKLNLVIERF